MHSITKFLVEGVFSAIGGILFLKIFQYMLEDHGALNSLVLLFFKSVNGG